MAVIPALWRQRQENCEFEASLAYIVRVCLKQASKQTNPRNTRSGNSFSVCMRSKTYSCCCFSILKPAQLPITLQSSLAFSCAIFRLLFYLAERSKEKISTLFRLDLKKMCSIKLAWTYGYIHQLADMTFFF
jgi:hypothetical protein